MVNPIIEGEPNKEPVPPFMQLCEDVINFLNYMPEDHFLWNAAFRLLERHPLSIAASKRSREENQIITDTMRVLNALHTHRCPNHFDLVESKSGELG